MKIELCTPGDLETKSFEFAGGKLSVEPHFYGKGTTANIAVVKVLDKNGKLIKLALLKVSGVDGAITVQDRTTPTRPAMETPKRVEPVKPPEK